MKNLNENNLKQAMHLYAEKMADEFPTDDEIADIEFSAEFERKMNRIIKQRSKPMFNLFNTTAKRVASIAVIFIVLLSVTFSVSAIREPFIEMIKTVFSNHVEIKFYGATKECITEIYGLEHIPDGFEITNESISNIDVNRENITKAGIILSYTQQAVAHSSGVCIDNEHSTHHTITIDKKEIYIVVSEWNITSAFWTDNGYSFSLVYYSKMDDEEITNIIESNTIVGYQEEE